MNVGRYCDKHASLLSRVILYGSHKYPGPSQFQDHIWAHNGVISTPTVDREYTTYSFSVDFSGLEMAMEMFAWLIGKPLIPLACIPAEMQNLANECAETHESNTTWKQALLRRY